ncbi:hypothetical protein T484DRAFT_1882697, partial [Baffinella frigidus]
MDFLEDVDAMSSDEVDRIWEEEVLTGKILKRGSNRAFARHLKTWHPPTCPPGKIYEYYDAPPVAPPPARPPRAPDADGGLKSWYKINETKVAALERGEWDGDQPPTYRDVLETFGIIRPLSQILRTSNATTPHEGAQGVSDTPGGRGAAGRGGV